MFGAALLGGCSGAVPEPAATKPSWAELGRSYLVERRDAARAARFLERALEQRPRDPALRRDLAAALRDLGDPASLERARALLIALAEPRPREPTLRFALAEIELLRGERAAAERWIERGAELLRARRDRRHRGVALQHARSFDGQAGYGSAWGERALLRLAQTGADSVALTPYTLVDSDTTPLIDADSMDPEGETDPRLIAAMRSARRMGLRVMLKPHLELRAPDDQHWRGSIRMRSEADWRRWFRNLTAYLLRYARIAAAEQAELYCLGIELKITALEREADWRGVIAAVREVYSGELTYGANWWEEYEAIRFWDALDSIGVQAFFPMGERRDAEPPSLAELEQRMARHAAAIAAVARRYKKPVLLTEIGLKSSADAAADAWKWTSEAPVDLRLQADFYRAMFRTYWGQPWLDGLYIWRWETDPGFGGPHNRDFTPQNKPAEWVMRRFFAGPRAIAALEPPWPAERVPLGPESNVP